MSDELIGGIIKGAVMAISLSLIGLLVFYVLNIIKKVLFKAKKTVTPLTKAVYNHSKDIVSEIKPAINEYKEKHSNSINSNTNNFPNEDEIYEQVLLEIEQDRKVKSTWAKALSQSDGDDKKAESIYIRERVAFILNEQNISNKSNNTSNNSYVENSQNNSSNAKLITGLIVGTILLAIGGPVYYKIQNNTTQSVETKSNLQTKDSPKVYTEVEKAKNNISLSEKIPEYRDWKIDNHISDYYLDNRNTQLIYVEEINPVNNKIEEGEHPITNIIKFDLINNNKTTLLSGCSKPSFRGNECIYSNPILLDDDRTLYYQKDKWVISDGIYKLDLITFEEKFITDGNELRIINEGKYKNYLVVNKHKYLKEGGSYDSNFIVSPDGKEISTITNLESYNYYKSKDIKQNNKFINLIGNLLYEWDKAHNNKDLKMFNLIYNENLNYYNKKNMNKFLAIEDKKRIFNKFLDFHQSSKLLKIEYLEKDIYKVNYEKRATYSGKTKTFFSYLIIRIINNNAVVIEEND